MKEEKDDITRNLKGVLLVRPQEGMYSVDIAKEIIANQLYFKKDGSFVDEKQVRSCANNNGDVFVCLTRKVVKLIVNESTAIVKGPKSDLGKYL